MTSRATDIVMIAGRDPYDEISGGHSSYVRGYARAAVAAGFTPHLFCVGRTEEVRETEIGVVHRAKSPWRPFRQLLAGAHARPLAAALTSFARGRRGPLLIHSFGVWGIAAVRSAAALSAEGVTPVLVQSSYTTYRDEALSHARAAAPYSPFARLRFAAFAWWAAAVVEAWEREAYRAAQVVLVNYQSVIRLIRLRHGDEVNCRVMPYAAESAFFDHKPATREGSGVPLLLSVARHEPRKGLDVLLHALARLKAEDVCFRAVLAGGGPLLDEHRRLASQLGLDGHVAIEGIVPSVQPFLDAADVFVLPSREEQSGSLAILEALQSSLPIVASAVDGIPEDLSSEDALLVPPADVPALTAALRAAILDAPLREKLRRRARKRFEERFSASHLAKELGAIYDQLLGDTQSPSS